MQAETGREKDQAGRCEEVTVGFEISGIQFYHARMSSWLQSTKTFNLKKYKFLLTSLSSSEQFLLGLYLFLVMWPQRQPRRVQSTLSLQIVPNPAKQPFQRLVMKTVPACFCLIPSEQLVPWVCAQWVKKCVLASSALWKLCSVWDEPCWALEVRNPFSRVQIGYIEEFYNK